MGAWDNILTRLGLKDDEAVLEEIISLTETKSPPQKIVDEYEAAGKKPPAAQVAKLTASQAQLAKKLRMTPQDYINTLNAQNAMLASQSQNMANHFSSTNTITTAGTQWHTPSAQWNTPSSGSLPLCHACQGTGRMMGNPCITCGGGGIYPANPMYQPGTVSVPVITMEHVDGRQTIKVQGFPGTLITFGKNSNVYEIQTDGTVKLYKEVQKELTGCDKVKKAFEERMEIKRQMREMRDAQAE